MADELRRANDQKGHAEQNDGVSATYSIVEVVVFDVGRTELAERVRDEVESHLEKLN